MRDIHWYRGEFLSCTQLLDDAVRDLPDIRLLLQTLQEHHHHLVRRGYEAEFLDSLLAAWFHHKGLDSESSVNSLAAIISDHLEYLQPAGNIMCLDYADWLREAVDTDAHFQALMTALLHRGVFVDTSDGPEWRVDRLLRAGVPREMLGGPSS